MYKQSKLFAGTEKKLHIRESASDEDWTLEKVIDQLNIINSKGFIPIPPLDFRRDEGVIGQILEKEFRITENNLNVRDLGTFELKGMRKKSSTLTLCHKTTSAGLSPNQIFDRFGYIRPSNRDPNLLKKKLFTTISGKKQNSLRLILSPSGEHSFILNYCHPSRNDQEYICTWDIKDSIDKIDSIILAVAETRGTTNSPHEEFHFIEAWLFQDLLPIEQLISRGIMVVDLCIDQPVSSNRGPHDRGPHIRISRRSLPSAYGKVERIM